MRIEAVIAPDKGAEFEIRHIEIGAPQGDEILVRIAGVGLCHTDIFVRDGGAPFQFPGVLGHEGSGVVEAVGPEVSRLRTGDRVVLSFLACRACPRCDGGESAYCRKASKLNYRGRRLDGGSALSDGDTVLSGHFFGQSSFATYAMASERNAVKVKDGLPLELLGPLGCSVQTGAGAMMRSLAAKAGGSALIAGGGAVGLSAVMGAKIQGCGQIIVLEPFASRRSLALELGATDVIDPNAEGETREALRAVAPKGVDYALDTTGAPPVQELCLAALGPRGSLGLVGLSAAGAKLSADLGRLVLFGQSIKGVIEGDSEPHQFLPELMAHFEAGRLPLQKLITKYPLREINRAIADHHAGRCVKALLLPGETA